MAEKVEDLTPKDELTANGEQPLDISDDAEVKDIRVKRPLSFRGEKTITITHAGSPAGSAADQKYNTCWFIADQNYEIVEAWLTADTPATGTAGIYISAANSGVAIASGTNMMGTDWDIKTVTGITSDTPTKGVLKADRRDRLIKKGQQVGIYFTGTLTGLVGLHVTIRLRAL